MGTVTIPSAIGGGPATSAQYNALQSAISFLLTPPQTMVYPSGSQNLANNAWTLLSFDSEVYDIVQPGDAPAHDIAVGSSRIYFRTAGKYEISGGAGFSPTSGTGYRYLSLRMNAAGSIAGGTQLSSDSKAASPTGATSILHTPPKSYPFAVGDYIEILGQQNSGGTLAVVGGRDTFLRVRFVGV